MGKGFHTWLHTNILVSAQVRRINGKQRFSYLRTGLPTLGWKHNQEEWKTFETWGQTCILGWALMRKNGEKKFILGNRLASLTGDGLALLLAHVRALQISFQVLISWNLKTRFSYLECRNLLTVLPWDASWHSLALGSEHKFFVAIIKFSTWVGSKPTSRLSWVIWLVRPFRCQYLRCPTFRSWDVMVPCEGQFPAAYHHHHEF